MTYIDGFRAGLEDCAKEADRLAKLFRSGSFVQQEVENGHPEHEAKIVSSSSATILQAFADTIRQKIANANAMEARAAKRGRP